MGLELEAIAAVVIGGTLLTGGFGFVAGSLIGALIQGVIQTIIAFEGTLDVSGGAAAARRRGPHARGP